MITSRRKYFRLAFTLLAVSMPHQSWASNPISRVNNASDLAAIIDSAHVKILLVCPELRHKPIASALIRANRQRGVVEMIIVDSRNPAGPSSYTPSLSLWENLEIRLAKNVRYCVMVIDDAIVIKGDLLGAPPSPLTVNNTVAINDQQEARRITKWFSTLWSKAPKFSFDPNSLK